jgi:hypothetical protein
MAARRKAEHDPKFVDESSYDQFAKELAEQIAGNEALLKGLKYEYGQKLLDAQQKGGDLPDPKALAEIKQLELTLQNDRMFLDARALTRRK